MMAEIIEVNDRLRLGLDEADFSTASQLCKVMHEACRGHGKISNVVVAFAGVMLADAVMFGVGLSPRERSHFIQEFSNYFVENGPEALAAIGEREATKAPVN